MIISQGLKIPKYKITISLPSFFNKEKDTDFKNVWRVKRKGSAGSTQAKEPQTRGNAAGHRIEALIT